MANSVGAFYQTVVAAAEEASQTLVFSLQAVDSIYWDYKPEQVALGQTINIAIPASRTSGVVDAGIADMTLTDASAATVPIVFNKHPQDAMLIRNFEQFNSPTQLRKLFMDSALKGVKENINAAVTALLTTGNFTANSAISTTGGIITTTQFLAGKTVLSDQKVPVNDVDNMTLLLASLPYNKMMDSGTTNGAAWVNAQIAGMRTAEAVRSTGSMPTSFGTTIKLDQQVPVTGSAPTRTWTNALIHRWAIAGVTRPLPQPDGKVVDFTYVDFGGIPILVQLGYNQIKQGYVLSVEAGYGLKVVRPEMGQLFSTAE